MPNYDNPSSRPDTVASRQAISEARARLESVYRPHPGDSQSVYTDTEGNFRAVDPSVLPSSFRGAQNSSSNFATTFQQEAQAYRDAILNARDAGSITPDQANQLFQTPYQDGRQILKEFIKNGPAETTNIPNGRVETGNGGSSPRSPNNPSGSPIPDSVAGEGAIPRVPPEVAAGAGVAGVAGGVAASAGETAAIPTVGSLFGGAAAAIAATPLTPGFIAVIAAIGGLAALKWYLDNLQKQKIANSAAVQATKKGVLYHTVCHPSNEPLKRNYDANLNLVGGGNSFEGDCYGPISDIRYFKPNALGQPEQESYPWEYSITCACTDAQGNPIRQYLYFSHYGAGTFDSIQPVEYESPNSSKTKPIPNTQLIKPDKDGQISNNVTNIINNTYNLPPATLPGLPSTTYQPPQSLPQHQDQQAKRVPVSIALDKVFQVTVSTPQTNPTVIFTPSNKPSVVQIGKQPNKDGDIPVTVKSPDVPIPTSIVIPQGNPVTIQSPGQQPITINPQSTDPNSTGTNKTIQQPTIYTGDPNNPAINAPQKTVEGATPSLFQPRTYTPTKITPTTPTTPATPATPQEQLDGKTSVPTIPDLSKPIDSTEIISRLIEIGTILGTIKGNTLPENIASASATGTCRTTQPGGCMNNLANNAAQNAAQNAGNDLFNRLNTAFNLGNLASNLGELALLRPIFNIVNIINTKLGEVPLVGGISGFLSSFKGGFDRFVEWSKPGRVLNMLAMLASLHNAFMLSAAAKQTILQMMSDWLQVEAPFFKAFGIDIPGEDGKNNHLDLNKLLDNTIEGLFEALLGEQTVKLWETRFKAFNRIYQAATNSLMAIQMMFFSVTMTLEILSSNSSSVANALLKYGVVGHHAYPHQNPNPAYQNKWTASIDTATHQLNGIIAGAMAIDMVAQGIIQGRQAIDQFETSQKEIKETALKEYELFENPTKVPEYKKALEDAKKSTEDSKGVIPKPEDIAKVIEGVFE